MNANAIPILAVFAKNTCLEVPLFQRSYVWNKTHQWEPLWAEIARIFKDAVAGTLEGPAHFLGAIVLEQEPQSSLNIPRRSIIDGQQRLMTLQLILAAFRDFCHQQGCEAIAHKCAALTANSGVKSESVIDHLKILPSLVDQEHFAAVLDVRSREAVEKAYPVQRRKYARNADPRPVIVEAYVYFADCLTEFFTGESDVPIANRLEACFLALKRRLSVVVIGLEGADDAQVIFETLNARGVPLLPSDLLRNYILMRAVTEDSEPQALYSKYWQVFDKPFWRQEVRLGNLVRARSDLFFQSFLSNRLGHDFSMNHLYEEYRHWIEREHPFTSVTDELSAIARQRTHFQRILQRSKSDILYPLTSFLATFDIVAAYPLLLHLLDNNTKAEEWEEYTIILESYFLRRAVCELPANNYKENFLAVIRALRGAGTSPETLRNYLLSLRGEDVAWPDDEHFRDAWLATHACVAVNNPRMVHALRRLEAPYLANKGSADHIVPKDWPSCWPLTARQ